MAEVTCNNCGKTFKNLSGWKSHMSRTHGGYDEQDLINAAGEGTGGTETSENIRARMNRFADTLPGGGGERQETQAGTSTAMPSSPAPMPGERRVRATPKKLKKILGGIPAKMLEEAKIELDSEDRDALDEAGEFLADVFGVEFSVPESKVTVESRFWAFVWVAGITLLIYTKHRFPFVAKYILKLFKPKDEENADTETAEEQASAASGN